MYLSYYIHQLKNHINEEIYNHWAKGFKLKDYDKKCF